MNKQVEALKKKLNRSTPEIRKAAERIGLEELARCVWCPTGPCIVHAPHFAPPPPASERAPSSASARAYVEAWTAGVRQIVGRYVLAGSIETAGAELGRAAKEHVPEIVGSSLLAWLTTMGQSFARNADPRYQRGGLTPRGFSAWLNETAASAQKPAPAKASGKGLGSRKAVGWTR